MNLRITELRDVLDRLPDPNIYGPPTVRLIVREDTITPAGTDVSGPVLMVPHRVVMFTKVRYAHGNRRWHEWEIEVSDP